MIGNFGKSDKDMNFGKNDQILGIYTDLELGKPENHGGFKIKA